MQKNVIFWEPKRSEKRNASGQLIPGEFVGKFRTKVAAGHPKAIRFHGENAAGVVWDYWGVEVDSIHGKLRWIDKVSNGDYGTTIVLFLETDTLLHRVAIKYDPYNLRNVVNHLAGLQRDIADTVINVSYWVRKAQDKNKVVKTDEKGKSIWSASISFRDIAPQFSYEEWRLESDRLGLDWIQRTRPDGRKEWDSSAEYAYWDSRLVGIQKFLLKTPDVLPFTYNSMTACKAKNPSGGGNLSDEEIDRCREIYELVKVNYRFPFGGSSVSADDVFSNSELIASNQSQNQESNNFPMQEPNDADSVMQEGFPEYDLPF